MQTASAMRQDDYDFDHLADACRANFAEVISKYGPHLFEVSSGDISVTGADFLYDAYLGLLPSQYRQHHTCSCCKQFIERYGRLAAIAKDGRLIPAIWPSSGVAEPYAGAVSAMARMVAAGKVTGVFLSHAAEWGTPVTGSWTHFSIAVPGGMRFPRGVVTAGQARAQKREDYGTLQRGLAEYGRDVVAQAVTLLDADALYRSEKVAGPARFLLDLHDARSKVHGPRRDNVTWLAVAQAPVGFCTPRSSMVGTLLDDVAAGKSFEDVKRNFAAKMAPTRYQRPQAAPAAGNIEQAEKLVEKMGLTPALRRRYARLDDLLTIWRPAPATPESRGEGVFSHLQPKRTEASTEPMSMMPIVITWAKFARTVLPDAKKIEVAVAGTLNFCGMVTASDAAAPPILQWDREEVRNPVSWYVYHHGSTPAQWSLQAGSWINVTAAVLQPSMWAGDDAFKHMGTSAILVLEGAKDTRMKGLALFPECLRSELHSIRSTIEAFSAVGTLDGQEDASANGIRVGTDAASPPIRVTNSTGTAVYCIDRWE